MLPLPPPRPPAPLDGMPPVAKLAAKVAHELNNPLDAVLRFVSLAQRKAKTGDYADLDRHLADAQFGLQRMAEILRELMEIGRETHDALSRPQQLAMPELIARAVRACTPQADQKGIHFRVDHPSEASTTVHDLRLLQVMANLLRNAIRYAGESGPITISAVREGAQVAITVSDCGPGLPEVELGEVFAPFYRPERARTRETGGAGLGLAIVRTCVEACKGSVVCMNRQPTGLEVVIKLALAG